MLMITTILYIIISEKLSSSRELQTTCPENAVCDICMSSSSNTWFNCTGCPPDLYLYQGLCWNACPIGASGENGACYSSPWVNFPIWLDLSTKKVLENWGLLPEASLPCATPPVFEGSNYHSFYFEKCSRLILQEIVIPYYYVISAWIYINRIKSSWLQIFSWNSDSIHINNNYLEFNQLVTETTLFPTVAWTYFYVAKSFDGSYLTFAISMNGETPIKYSLEWGSDFYLIDSQNSIYLGAPPSATNKDGFTGFLYHLIISPDYDDSYLNYDFKNSWCNWGCSTCTSSYKCLPGDGCGNQNCEYCETQSNSKWFGCTSCPNNLFLYQGICYTACPSGTSEDSSLMVCTKTSSYAIYLPMSETISTTPYGWNLGTDLSSSKPPYPVLNKGYFFDHYSYMWFNFEIPVWTAISGWFYFDILSTPYYIFGGYDGLTHFILNLDSQNLVFKKAKNSDVSIMWNEWVYLYVSQSTDEFLAYYTVSVNNAAYTLIEPIWNVSDYSVNNGFDWYIGCFPSSLGGTIEGFKGFMYNFIVRSDYESSYASADYWTANCKGECSACPSTSICPSTDCNINPSQYRAISTSCHSCLFSSCIVGCVRGTDCSLCLDNCISCSSFSTCAACKVGYLLGPTFTSCVKRCPAGSSDNGSSQCVFDSSNGYIFSFTFDQIKGLVSDDIHGTNVMAGTSDSFYPNYSDDSPKAVKDRGYYFNGQSLMQFPLGVSVMYNSDFSLSSWIFAPDARTGVIVSKQVLDPDVIMKFEINSNKRPQLVLYLTLGSETATTSPLISDFPIDGTQWYSLAFSVSYNTPYSYVTFYSNGVASSIKFARGAFIDLLSDYSITIGAQRSMSNFFNFFSGYLYSLKSWNIANNPTTIDISYCSCGICPSTTVGCLSTQGINKYWNGNAWVSCTSPCSNIGCVRDDTICNLCESQSCFLCDDWTGCLIWCDPSCLTCVGPSSEECVLCADGSRVLGTSYGSCTCTSNNQYVKSADPFICGNCHSSCASCIGPNYDDCLLCANEQITINDIHGYCECKSNQYIVNKSPIECGDCDPSCLNCSGPGQKSCTSCDPGLILYENGHCSCGFAVLQNSQCVDCSDPSCQACLNTPENCVACFNPKILEDNSCICPLGMVESLGVCVPNEISVDEKYSNKVIYLTFSEDLSEVLNDSDFNITVFETYEIATFFELDFISLSSYQISIDFNPSKLASNAILQVYITSPKYGISGSALQKRLFTHNIKSSSDDSETAMDFVASIFPRTLQAILTSLLLLYGGICYVMLRKSTTLWTYVNTVQIIAFMPLQNIQIPKDLYNMLKGFISYTWIPNLGEMIYGSLKVGNRPIIRFSSYGYKSGLFLISAGSMIFLTSVFLMAWNILWLMSEFIHNQNIKNLLSNKVLVNFMYNWLLRLLVEIYILAFCGIVIGINNFNGKEFDLVLDFIISWALFILNLTIIFKIFGVLWSNKENIILKDEKFYKKFSMLVEDFHCEKGIISICYFPIFFIRRTIYVIALYNLYDLPLFQSILNACCSFLTLIFLVKYHPYKDKFDNQVEISSEILVTLLFIVVIPFIDTNLSISARETCQIIAVLATLIFLLYSYYLLLLKLIRKIRSRKNVEMDTIEGISAPNNSIDELSLKPCELDEIGLN